MKCIPPPRKGMSWSITTRRGALRTAGAALGVLLAVAPRSRPVVGPFLVGARA